MRISDWSSDVCSSDLLSCRRRGTPGTHLSRRRALKTHLDRVAIDARQLRVERHNSTHGQLPQAAHTAKLLVSPLSARSGRSLSHWAPSRTRRKNARITAFVSKTFDCVPEVIWWPPLKSIVISTGRPDVVAACRRAAVRAEERRD